MHVLLIEDDEKTAAYVAKGLIETGFVVDCVADGRDGLYLATDKQYDVAVIDRMVPGLDGLAVVQAMRSAGIQTPVLFLSALGQVDERVKGLRAGGDDYLAKPFAFSELLARVEALARRRAQPTVATTITVGDLELDLLQRTGRRAGKRIELLAREYRILEYLMRHAGQVVTRTMLLEGVWDYHYDPQTNVIDVHVSRLRQKIDKGFDRPMIQTIRGLGYCLRAPD